MIGSGSEGALTICLVTGNIDTAASVRASCPPPNEIHIFEIDRLVNEQHTISDHGKRIVESAASSDVVLIDWSFDQSPAINTLCFQIRRDLLAPVLMVSRDGPETLTACLAAGADDAVNLPIYLPYIQAKVLSYRRLVKAVRQAHPWSNASQLEDESVPDLVFGNLRLSPRTHRFLIDDEEVELTPREFALLEYLIGRPDTLLSRGEILDAVWGINFDTGTNMVDVYMHYVRRKLEARGLKDMLETVRGLGYRLVIPDPSATGE